MIKGDLVSAVTLFCTAALAGCTLSVPPSPPSAQETLSFAGKEGLVILSVKSPDGELLPFILDTGASPCVVDPIYAGRFGVQANKTTERQGGAGAFNAQVSNRPVKLSIDRGSSVTCAETLIIDLAGVAEVAGVRPAGLIGGDFFRNRIVEIDHDRRALVIHKREVYRRPREGAIIPIRVEKNRPYLKASLSVPGGPEDVVRELLIDNGSLDHVADPLLKESKTELRTVARTGLGSGGPGAAGTWSKVEIGPYRFENVPGNVPNVAIVGNGILSQFNQVFDYEGGWLMLRSRKVDRRTRE